MVINRFSRFLVFDKRASKMSIVQEGKTAEILQKCRHFLKAREYRDEPNYPRADGGYGMKIFLGERCLECNYFFPRPKGTKLEICHKCGNKMERNNKQRMCKCESCGHKEKIK